MSYRDQIEDAARDLGDELLGELIGEARKLGRDGVRRLIEAVKRRRDRKVGLAVERGKDRVADALDERIRRDQGEGHQ